MSQRTPEPLAESFERVTDRLASLTPGQRAWSLRGFAVQLRKAGDPESRALAEKLENLAAQADAEPQ